MDISSALSTAASSPQATRPTAYLSLLASILSDHPHDSASYIAFAEHFTGGNNITSVLGRRVLGAFLVAVTAGTTLELKGTATIPLDEEGEGDKAKWEELGKQAFQGEKGEEARREVVEGILQGGNLGGSDEQVAVLRHLNSHLLTLEEDYEGAARALMAIQVDSGSRMVSENDKLQLWMSIVRLFLECGEWGMALTYYSRATNLPPPQDKETRLAMRFAAAKLSDFSNEFDKAAQAYHTLSLEPSIDPTDRLQILSASVTTAILAPSGPRRSRILASLNRDDRVHQELPGRLGQMLKKMLEGWIVRAEEVREFESGLEGHQRATVEGGGTVLERAIREHNIGACAKVYDNISFDSLGSILSLPPSTAERTARLMIQQSRLPGWIDQPNNLLFFHPPPTHQALDAEQGGTAGGLNVVKAEKEVEKVGWGERWDERIGEVCRRVEGLAEEVVGKGLVVV
ncbi:hypothetical protein B9479_007270 [Cryptococcus floricola]|uniref:COP9 signalosome complex subunit 4 n=1 Tax=Cryptococcus floricola TaxID=2591691 RepID=A0A5D3AKW8_9TREE|nr:hypothetical protein B9479_007270 [Cryptococcus floricola]